MKSNEQSVKNKIEDLIRKMTLEEKIAQLGSIPIRDLMEDGKFSSQKAQKLLINGIGQITRIAGGSDLEPKQVAEIANAIQKFLIENTRLKSSHNCCWR